MAFFKSIDDVINFALTNEEEAYNLYLNMAESTDDSSMKETFLAFAKVELGHKEKLISFREKKSLELMNDNITNLNISDFAIDFKTTENMSYQEAILFAVEAEKASYKLYSTLVERTDDPILKDAFNKLAIEESKHQIKLEMIYNKNSGE